MNIITHLDYIPKMKHPIALTIGVYDGVHLGHQSLFKELHRYTRKEGSSVVLTFSNHPTTLLNSAYPLPLITLLDHRLLLLQSLGFDLAIVLPFDQALANLSYKHFIRMLHRRLPFDQLVLGFDARFGKDRAGDPFAIRELGKSFRFHTQYLPQVNYHKYPISSDRIRSCLERGDLKRVKKMLGRPYSICVPFKTPIQESIVQHQLELHLEGICALPSAVYAVDIGKIPAIAFYRSMRDVGGRTKVSITLYFEQPLPTTNYLTLNFISYLHDELDSELTTESYLVETLKLQPTLHFSPDLQALTKGGG